MCLKNSIRGWFPDGRESEIRGSSETELLQFWRQQRHNSLLKSSQKSISLFHYYHQVTDYQRLGSVQNEVSQTSCMSSFPHTSSKRPALTTTERWTLRHTHPVQLFVQHQARRQEAASPKLSYPSHQFKTHTSKSLCSHTVHMNCTSCVLGSECNIMITKSCFNERSISRFHKHSPAFCSKIFSPCCLKMLPGILISAFCRCPERSNILTTF